MLKPTLFTVLTLGLIGTWQVFDQIYLAGGGAPGKTTLTPAYLAYETSFKNLKWGRGAAIAFVLFVIIVVAHAAAALRPARSTIRGERRAEAATAVDESERDDHGRSPHRCRERSIASTAPHRGLDRGSLIGLPPAHRARADLHLPVPDLAVVVVQDRHRGGTSNRCP